MELRHLQRAFEHATDTAAAKAIISKHGGTTPDSVPEENIDAATADIRALGSGPASLARLQTVADLDATAIYARWNSAKRADY